MARFRWRTAVVAALLAAAAAGQGAGTQVEVQAILVDGQLNQKPVPRLEVRLQPASGGQARLARTDFDGHAQLLLAPGTYTLSTPDGIGFDGQTFQWRLPVTVSSKPVTVTLSNDNAMAVGAAAAPPPDSSASAPDLVAQSRRLQPAVVTVWSDLGHGSGFIVALSSGQAMILTNDHVVTGARYLAVQTDARHKAAAILLSEDRDRDVAALAANLTSISQVAAATLATSGEVEAEPAGAAVFTIGSPLNQQKILTAGIIGKNDPHAFISDININHGNSGGPLFNAAGHVIGITTFGDDSTEGGPGLSGIIKITEADAVLGRAEAKFESEPPLPLDPLPTAPVQSYPLDALKTTVRQRHFDEKLYQFSSAGYDVTVATPPLIYWRQTRGAAAIGRAQAHHSKSHDTDGGFDPAGDLRTWMQYTGEYAPVVWIEMTPHLRPTVSSWFLHSLTKEYTRGRSSRDLRLRFQADFGRMELDCGGRKIVPIAPGRIPEALVNEQDKPEDAAWEGIYEYAPDAITPACGAVSLTVYDAGAHADAHTHALSDTLVHRVWDDFAAWRAAAATH